MDDPALRLLTWNVQGAHGLDVGPVAAAIRAAGPDVVALQEVQRRQAAALAQSLAMPARRWAWKHWPVAARAEGLAVLTAHRLAATSPFSLRRRPFWDWRRRIGLDATVELDGRAVGLLDVHLSPHGDAARRRSEAEIVLARTIERDPAPVIAGDLNDQPGQGAHAAIVAAGWIDCWSVVHADDDDVAGATNWTAGPRDGRPPTQRLDYVLVPPGSVVEHCAVAVDPTRLDDFAVLSDHLPLVATVRLPGRRQ